MMTGWPLNIDGHQYRPIPESWIEHGLDDRDGDGPQLLAVSVAHWRGTLRIRYAHPYGHRVGARIEPVVDHNGGQIPRTLKTGSWPRSISASQLEPISDVRLEERRHLEDIWSDRIDHVLEKTPDCDLDDRRLVPDGGHCSDDTDHRGRAWYCSRCGARRGVLTKVSDWCAPCRRSVSSAIDRRGSR